MKTIKLFCLTAVCFLISTNWNLSSGQNFQELLDDQNITNFYEIEAIIEEQHKDDKGSREYKQWKKWANQYESYFAPSGEIVNYQKIIAKEYNSLLKNSPTESNKSTHGLWLQEGPTDWQPSTSAHAGGIGRINVFVKDANNGNNIYAGAATGGLWKSNNGGNSWSRATHGIPSLGVSGIAVDYMNNNKVYILTGDGDGSAQGMGVYKSTDFGNTWSRTGEIAGGSNFWTSERGYKLIMHPTNPNILIAATSQRLCKSTNGGLTWATVSYGVYTDVEFKPGDPTVVYAVTKTRFYRSTLGGDIGSWSIVNDTDFPATGTYHRLAIGIAPSYPDLVYLLFGGSSTVFLRSLDEGQTFDLRMDNSGGSNNIMGGDCQNLSTNNHQAWYDIAITVNPTNYNEVFVGGILIFKSYNGGLDWVCAASHPTSSEGYTHADIHNLSYEGTELIVCSDGGIYKSTNNGIDWIDMSAGISNMQIGLLDVSGTRYLTATQDNGCNVGTLGSSLIMHSVDGDGVAAALDYNNPNIMYTGAITTRWRSNDGGITSVNITPTGTSDYWGPDLIVDAADPSIVYLGEKGKIFRTFNGSTVTSSTWQLLNTGFPNKQIKSIDHSSSNFNTLYALCESEIRKSSNIRSSTPSFINITAGLPVSSTILGEVAVDPTNDQIVYVTIAGMVAGQKIYRSTNGGNTWSNISFDLPNLNVSAIIVDDTSSNGVYLGTDVGIFYKNEGMSEWVWFSNGLPPTLVFDLDIEGSRIYAGTYGSGLWSSDLYFPCFNLGLHPGNDPSPSNFTGKQVYHAADNLSSTRVIQGGTGTDVEYYSENYIDLKEGFWVKEDNLFIAKNENCPN